MFLGSVEFIDHCVHHKGLARGYIDMKLLSYREIINSCMVYVGSRTWFGRLKICSRKCLRWVRED